MTTLATVNTNVFRQTPIRGARDLGIVAGSGSISMQISPNEDGTLYAGYRVKLDPAITAPMPFPQVVAALDNEAAFATIGYSEKQTSFIAGDVIEALGLFGPVQYQQAANTIVPGVAVEMASGFVQTKAAGALYGICLDPGVLNGFVRVMTQMPA